MLSFFSSALLWCRVVSCCCYQRITLTELQIRAKSVLYELALNCAHEDCDVPPPPPPHYETTGGGGGVCF
jgi:hypothetical protein